MKTATKDRRLPGKKRVRARRQARRTASVLGGTAATVAPDGASVPTAGQQAPSGPKELYSYEQLDQKKLVRLKQIAKELGLKGYSGLKKAELIDEIWHSEKNRIR